ncbi:MAG: glycoside hydrolase family 32 protein [Armatimonadetes bacterium]|nr:glycoside hydrolase family 32 protein [Armatimonadota bacterium]
MSLLALACALVVAPQDRQGDIPVMDFRGANYGSWTMTGDAFQPGPASGDLLVRLEIVGVRDGRCISSEVEGDQPRGTLISPPITIERDFITFLIGGGDYERCTCLDLVVDGEVVRSATGRNSDTLAPQSWDVRAWRGKKAHIVVVDKASGDWGHINVDRIVQTDQPETPPVSVGPLYKEALRPGFHFTARQWTMDRLEPAQRQEGWINDLNGLIYYDGEWHLFAQRWAKCWLHAVSRDLVHWTELQPAFWEESEGSGVQSGTCVIDYHNTSGLSVDPKKPPMVAFWSRFDNRSQCISFSLDHGRTWTRYAGNPVFEHPERDPKVFWYDPPGGGAGHWVMVMYGEESYHILTSPDLLHWKDEGHPIPQSFECPDFFQLPLDGDKSRKQWVLVQGSGNYSIGMFDGHEFKEQPGRFACDLGPNFYATQSWHNTDTGDGRRIQVAWMRGPHFPGMPFNQQVSFPCELSLRSTPAGPRLFRSPIKEVSKLEAKSRLWPETRLEPGEVLQLSKKGEMFRLIADVDIPEGANLIFALRGEAVTLSSRGMVSGEAHGNIQGQVKRVEILLDRASIETFVNDGELSSTRTVLPRSNGLFLKADGGPIVLRSLRVAPLSSSWR